MRCNNCNDNVSDVDVRWAFEEPYCEECFDNMFNYCCHCDNIMTRDNTHFSNEGEAYCDECYQDEYEDDSPNNPEVSKADRELIIHLSRAWLSGKVEHKRLISINEKDYLLKAIRDKVGLVGNPLYLYGLQDREEYQIKASSDIISLVKEYLLINGIDAAAAEETAGTKRLGVSYFLRENNLKDIVNLIKSVTEVKQLQTA